MRKGVILVIFCLFYCLSTYSYNKLAIEKSDSLFAIGVELYNDGKYAEAIPFFSESDKIDKVEYDSISNRRDYSAMWLASCYYRMGNEQLSKEICKKYYMVEPIDRRRTIAFDSLSTIAKQCFKKGNYKEAIRIETEAMHIFENSIGKEHPIYATILNNLARYNIELANHEETLRQCTEAMEIFEISLGKEHPDYATSLSIMAQYNDYIGNFIEALRLETEAIKIIEITLGDNTSDYAESLSKMALYNAQLGNYENAFELSTKAMGIIERTLGKENISYAEALSALASYNNSLSNYTEAIQLYNVAMEIIEQTIGQDNLYYAGALVALSNYNSLLGNYTEATQLCTIAMEIIEQIIGQDNLYYAEALVVLSISNFYIGNYSESFQMSTEALEIIERIVGKNCTRYAISLSSLSLMYANIGDYTKALEMSTESLEIIKKAVGEKSLFCVGVLISMANYNSALGNYAEAISLVTETLEIMEKNCVKENPIYALSLNNLAQYNLSIGDYNEVISLGTEAMEIMERTLGKEHPNYAMSLNGLADYNFALGNYSEAIRLGIEALEVMEKVFGKENQFYAIYLNDLANYYCALGNYSEAIRLGTEALEIRERIFDKEHPCYAISLGNLAYYNSEIGNYSEAIRLGTEALEIIEKVFGKEHPNYATLLSNLANYNSELNNDVEAIRLGAEAMTIVERNLGKEHPDYANLLRSMARYTFLNEDYDDTSYYTIQAAQTLSRFISNTFLGLTTIERSLFWNEYNYWFERTIPFYAFYINNDSLIATAYDGILLSKGLLLNSEIGLNNLLLESGDDIAVSKYQTLQSNRAILNKLYEKPIDERYISTDSLERVVQDQERELVQLSKAYGDYMKNLHVNWRQVRDKMGDNDVAIEFLDFGAMNDSIMYVALTLTKNDSCPKMIPLFEVKQLEKIDKLDYYETKELSDLVWKPLEDIINDKENIYFAPAGELHNIAIESIPYFDGDGYMSDKWNLYRLSSTRELALEKESKEKKDAYVYGDLTYDTDVDVLVANSEKYNDTRRDIDWEVKNIADSLSLRDITRKLLRPLPATRREVENVDKALKAQHVNSTLLTDTIGTETSFKAISGTKPSIIHIATHGFYWPESDVKTMNVFKPQAIASEDSGPKYVEDKALTRSGLFFAGAQNAFSDTKLPDDVDDGILTAKEISVLDLRGLDLVVLSACETGLGDITGDGVFGLQRGFLKAGANTLLMSLWKVDDTATEILMSRFYSNLADGKTKYDSFRDAQQYLRDYKSGEIYPYTNPEYWAAFILLDALE